jgi:type II secretory pathway component PulF
MRAGHLPAALEGLSQSIRRAADTRRSIAAALIYPFIVVAIACGFLTFSLTKLVPTLFHAYKDLVSRADPVLDQVEVVARYAHTWGPWVPEVLLVAMLVWWYRSGRALRVMSGRDRGDEARYLFGRRGSRRLSSIAQALRDGRMATFADLLRLMYAHRVPLPEALVLAADASGDQALSRGTRQIAGRLEAGEILKSRSDLPAGFPPLLGWSLLTGAGQEGISRALAASAEMYRQRSERTVQWSTTYLPILLTAVIGGGAVLLHALLIFLPFTRMLYQLGLPQ